MQLVDLSKPGEKKKLISAGVLGLVAIIVLWWAFIGFDSGTTTAARPTASPTPQRAAQQNTQRANNGTVSPEVRNLAGIHRGAVRTCRLITLLKRSATYSLTTTHRSLLSLLQLHHLRLQRHLRRCCWRQFLPQTFTRAPRTSNSKLRATSSRPRCGSLLMVANCRLRTRTRSKFRRRFPRRSLPHRERAT